MFRDGEQQFLEKIHKVFWQPEKEHSADVQAMLVCRVHNEQISIFQERNGLPTWLVLSVEYLGLTFGADGEVCRLCL
jgi:hypothetical protein